MNSVNEHNGKNPFRVPENYFNEVTRKIISETSGYEMKKKNTLYARVKPYLSIAAFISGIVLITYITIRILSSTDLENKIPLISVQEFSESYLYDIDISTLEESGELLLSSEYPELEDSDIIDYLLLENIDFNEIYELY